MRSAKKKLIDNTEAFVKGRPANNCLLFGDAGTGKSSSIKAILNQYYDQGLRMIEIYKHQFQDLNDVIAQIKNRNYKFIIYMDDLSFEEFEIEYKYLKAVIEGGLGEEAGKCTDLCDLEPQAFNQRDVSATTQEAYGRSALQRYRCRKNFPLYAQVWCHDLLRFTG